MKTSLLKPLRVSVILVIFFSAINPNVFAQNCTVNAGIDKTVCAGTSIIHEGNIGGNFVANSVIWTQVSGPGAATITNNTSISPTFSNLVPGTYIFQIQATCQIGGNAIDQCTFTVLATATPVAPSNIVLGCYTPGTPINLTGTAPAGHTLSWSVVSNSAPAAGTFNGPTQTSVTGNNPTVQFASPPSYWCVTGGSNAVINVRSTNTTTGCSENRTFSVFYTYRPPAVSAVADPPQVCGTCVRLIGSCQQGGTGLWTVISSPGGSPPVSFSPNNSTATVNACNLVPGNYTFRWTVSGSACTTGSADVTVNVSPPQSVTVPIANSKRFCPGTLPSTVSLEGNVPGSGQTVAWTQVSGPAVTITNASSPHAQASGLTEGGAPYIFKYTITNTGCSLSDTMMISVTKPLGYQPTQNGSCHYSNQSFISRFIGSIPFMHSDSIPVSIIYESGPALNMQVMFQATMYTESGGTTGINYYSPTINITRGGTATYVYQSNLLWPTYNQLRADLIFWFYTNNNIPSCFNILPGIYRFRLQFKDHCGTYTSEPFETRVSSVGAFNAGSDQMLNCGTAVTTLAGNAQRCEITPFWTTVRKPAAAPNPITAGNMYSTNPVLSGLQNGTYIFQWSSNSSSYGCPVTSDSVKINVSITPPATPVVTGGGSYCIGGPIAISGDLNDDAASGSWAVTTSPLGGTYTITPNINSPTIVFTPTSVNTTYTLTWTVINGCGSAAGSTNVVTGSGSAVVPDITTTNNCFSYTTLGFGTLTATPAGGVWSSSNPNYSLVTPNNATTTVSPSSFSTSLGNVVFYYTLTGPCGTLRDSVSFGAFQTPTLPNGNFCSVNTFPTTQTFTLTNLLPYSNYEIYSLTGPGTISVTPMSFVPASTSQNFSITVGQSGQYSIALRQRAGSCNVTTSYTFQFSSLPQLAIAGPDINLCGTTNSVNLNAQPNPLGSSAGIWSIQSVYSGFPPVIANSTSPTSAITFNNGGGDVLLRWSVSGDNSNCSNATQDYLRVRYIPGSNAGLNDFTCYDASGSPASMVLAANNAGPGIGTWSIILKPAAATPTFINPSLPNTTIVGLLNGWYQLRWTITDPLGICPPTTSDVYLLVYYGCELLPLDLLEFDGKPENKNTVLSWKVAKEEQNVEYYLERAFSSAGPFGTIGIVHYNSDRSGQYQYIDKNIPYSPNGYLYYRLKIKNDQNKISYSKIIKIKANAGKPLVNVYPTLISKGELIHIAVNSPSAKPVNYSLLNANGQRLRNGTVASVSDFVIRSEG
jgi:large repetitive protein